MHSGAKAHFTHLCPANKFTVCIFAYAEFAGAFSVRIYRRALETKEGYVEVMSIYRGTSLIRNTTPVGP
jgi:hypothetical protein